MESRSGGAPLAYTPKEAADLLHVSTKTVYRLIASRQLTAIRIGSLRRVTPAALNQFLKRREQQERNSALAPTEVAVVR